MHDRETDDACGVCAACAKNQNLFNSDLHFCFSTQQYQETTKTQTVLAGSPNAWIAFLTEQPLANWNDGPTITVAKNKQAIISRDESLHYQNPSLKPFGAPMGKVTQKSGSTWAGSCHPDIEILEEPPENTFFPGGQCHQPPGAPPLF